MPGVSPNPTGEHAPLYRQSAILQRDASIEVSRATLDGWVIRVGELLTPIVGMMRRELLGSHYIQADETPVEVQMHEGRGKNHLAYLWQYGSPRGAVVFDFRLGRGRDGPKQFLKPFEGILQTAFNYPHLNASGWVEIRGSGSRQALMRQAVTMANCRHEQMAEVCGFGIG